MELNCVLKEQRKKTSNVYNSCATGLPGFLRNVLREQGLWDCGGQSCRTSTLRGSEAPGLRGRQRPWVYSQPTSRNSALFECRGGGGTKTKPLLSIRRRGDAKVHLGALCLPTHASESQLI